MALDPAQPYTPQPARLLATIWGTTQAPALPVTRQRVRRKASRRSLRCSLGLGVGGGSGWIWMPRPARAMREIQMRWLQRPARRGMLLQHLLPEALGVLQTRRTAIRHHDQICGAARANALWAWIMEHHPRPNGQDQNISNRERMNKTAHTSSRIRPNQ